MVFIVLKFLCAVLPNSPQHDITLLKITFRADLEPSDIVTLFAERKSRVDTGIELFVSLINKHCSSENNPIRRRNTWDTVKYIISSK